MLIDKPQQLRKKILKTFPFPDDKDIMLRNQAFYNLAGKNVDTLYRYYLNEYNELHQKTFEINKKLNEYDCFISNVKLIDNKLNEQQHIDMIQLLEIEYARKYEDLKKIEKKIEIYENKIKSQNEKIENQEKREKQLIEKEKEEKIKELRELDIKIGELETYVNFFKDYSNDYLMLIKMIDNEKKYYSKLIIKSEKDEKGIYPPVSELTEKINKINERIDDHNYTFEVLKSKEKEYKKKLKEAKQNDIELKKEIKLEPFYYTKKSPEILKLESEKFKLFNDLEKLEKELNDKIPKNDKEYNKLKEKIQAYKDSFYNLIEIKKISKEIPELQKSLDEYNNDIKKVENKLKPLVNFFDMRYKVYEDRINNFFDGNIKLKLFKLEGVEFKEILDIKYKNIDVDLLTNEQAKEANEMILEKINFYGGDIHECKDNLN